MWCWSSRRPGAVSKGIIDIAVVQAQRIANFTDFDALASETSVSLRYVSEAAALGEPDVIILPGTKSTVADLASLQCSGYRRRDCTVSWRGHRDSWTLRWLPDVGKGHP